MAMEVSCGQCHGRLLVETPGVVVACPHCGVHLSIPAPEPAVPTPPQVHDIPTLPSPAPVPTPAPVPEPVVPPPHLPVMTEPMPHVEVDAPAAFAEFANAQPASINSALSFTAAAPGEDPQASSVLVSEEVPANAGQLGWASAPNLYLSPEEEPPAINPAMQFSPATPPVQSVDMPVSKLSEPAAPADGQIAQFPEFGERTAPTTPAWTFSASPAAASEVVKFSMPQLQDSKTIETVQPAPTPAVVQFQAAPEKVVFGAAPLPATSSAAPAQFVAAPPMTFGAAPAISEAAPSAGFTFNTAIAPPSTPSALVDTLPATTAADDATGFANGTVQSSQRSQMMLLVIVGSYASAVTIVLLYILLFARSSALESLPDLKPRTGKNGQLSWDYNPPKNDLPSGHVLTLGQTQRFGNVRVTPVKVTRGSMKYQHLFDQQAGSREPSPPVLKLWVKFENVSRDQTFAPLDNFLLYTRDNENLGQVIRANGFVTVEADRKKKGHEVVHIFDMPVHSEFQVIGQNLNTEIGPGSSVESFIPSEVEGTELSGDLVWRFQMRKGYNPQSLRGVTTLIDVRFKSSDITNDS